MPQEEFEHRNEYMDLVNRGIISPDETYVGYTEMHPRYRVLWWILIALFGTAFLALLGYFAWLFQQPAGGGPPLEPEAPFVAAGSLLLFFIPVFFGIRHLHNSRRSWLALTTRDRIIGKVPAPWPRFAPTDIDLPIRFIQDIEIKQNKSSASPASSGGIPEFIFQFVFEVLVQAAFEVDAGRIYITMQDGARIKYSDAAHPGDFFGQVQLARQRIGCLDPNWRETEREKEAKRSRRAWVMIVLFFALAGILFALALFLPNKSENPSPPAGQAGRAANPPPQPDTAKTEAKPAGQPSGPPAAKSFFDQAKAAKDPDQKIALLAKAVELDPAYVQAYNSRASIYYDKTDYEKALADYNRSVELNPNDPNILNKRGVVY